MFEVLPYLTVTEESADGDPQMGLADLHGTGISFQEVDIAVNGGTANLFHMAAQPLHHPFAHFPVALPGSVEIVKQCSEAVDVEYGISLSDLLCLF